MVQAHHRHPRRPLFQSVNYDSKSPHARALLDHPPVVCERTPPLRQLVDHPRHRGHARLLPLGLPEGKIGKPPYFADFSSHSMPHVGRIFCHLPDYATGSLLAPAILSKSLVSTALAECNLPVLFVCWPSNKAEILF